MKIEVTETRDWKAVWEIYQTPEIVDRVTNDQWERLTEAARQAYVQLTVSHPKNHTFLVFADTQLAGCFLAVYTPPCLNPSAADPSSWHNGNPYHMVHTMLTRKCRGGDGIVAGKKAMEAVFALPDVERLESWCPANNPESYYFARMCGWHKAGFAPIEWVKNGQHYPIRVVTMTRERFSDLYPKLEDVCR